MKQQVIDAKTGKSVLVDMTPEQIALQQQFEKEAQEEASLIQQAKAEEQAKLESAKAKLTALGLDEAEVQAILGL